jgi:hypothetical protein
MKFLHEKIKFYSKKIINYLASAKLNKIVDKLSCQCLLGKNKIFQKEA